MYPTDGVLDLDLSLSAVCRQKMLGGAFYDRRRRRLQAK
eukprot:SAG25_NODE_14837_length_231_cov_59.651515_1_plen_38_part_10